MRQWLAGLAWLAVATGNVCCAAILYGTEDDALDCAHAELDIDPQLVLSCVLRSSCAGDDSYTMSQCIEWNIPDSSDYDRCTLDARYCSDIAACFATNASFQQRTSVPCDSTSPFKYQCEGDDLIFCQQQNLGIRLGCERAGGHCDRFSCERAGCEDIGSPRCEERCIDGTHAELCLHDYPWRLDCRDYGFNGCVEVSDDQVRCL